MADRLITLQFTNACCHNFQLSSIINSCVTPATYTQYYQKGYRMLALFCFLKPETHLDVILNIRCIMTNNSPIYFVMFNWIAVKRSKPTYLLRNTFKISI